MAGKEDQDVVNSIAQNDKIVKVTVEGDFSGLLDVNKAKVDAWKKVLDNR